LKACTWHLPSEHALGSLCVAVGPVSRLDWQRTMVDALPTSPPAAPEQCPRVALGSPRAPFSPSPRLRPVISSVVIFDHSCQSDVGEGENDASDNIVLSLGTCTRADVALGSAHYWSKSLLGEVGSACRPDLGERHLVSLDVAKVGFRNLYRGAIGDGRDYPRGACHTASQRVPPTTIITYPSPYQPSYDTVASLPMIQPSS